MHINTIYHMQHHSHYYNQFDNCTIVILIFTNPFINASSLQTSRPDKLYMTVHWCFCCKTNKCKKFRTSKANS